MSEAERTIYKVSELTRLIRRTLEGGIGAVWVEGELSNVRRPSSGHYYLTIKDQSSQISAVLFKGNQRGIKFQPADGVQVRVFGEISVYEPSGSYQIIIRSMEESGKGALQEIFEKLKEKLLKEGLFNEDRKKRLPVLPQHVGIVTSRTGAAIRDILNVVTRRFPNLHIVLAPVKVQGEGAAVEIAEAIDLLNEFGGLDVMIVGRGGGSIEDLWCFNEEIVARAIARSVIPVISAVGHEIDFTISDFVADLRAPTPSAAAELVVGCKDEFEDSVRHLQNALVRALRENVLQMRNRFLSVSDSYIFREPRNMIKQTFQRLDSADMRMANSLCSAIRKSRSDLERTEMQARYAMEKFQGECVRMVTGLSGKLGAMSPLAVLGRGYSVTMDERGRPLKQVQDLKKGIRVVTRLHDGSFESEVSEVMDSSKE